MFMFKKTFNSLTVRSFMPLFRLNTRAHKSKNNITRGEVMQTFDQFRIKTGAFMLVLIAVLAIPMSGNAQTITIAYDTLITDSIDNFGDIDRITFSGTAGDRIILRVDPSGSAEVTLELYNPDYSLFVTATASNGGQVRFVDLELEMTGTYNLFISETQANEIFTYLLSLQCREHLIDNAIPISYDTLVNDTVALYDEIDAYTFSGVAGERILLRVEPAGTNTTFRCLLELYGPTDTLFISDYDNYTDVWGSYGGRQVNFIDYELPETGTYTIFIREGDGTPTSAYWLSLQCREHLMDNALPISYDTLVNDTVAISGEIDAYTFSGVAGERIILQVEPAGTNTKFRCMLELYGPSNTYLIYDYDDYTDVWGNYGGRQVNFIDYVLPETGDYTIFIREGDGTPTSAYWMSLQCREHIINNAMEVVYDFYYEDAITPFGAIDGYTFYGDSSDIITLRVEPAGTNTKFRCMLELYGPSDTLFIYDYDDYTDVWGDYGGRQVNFIDYVLPESGDYTIFIREGDGAPTSTFWMSLQCKFCLSKPYVYRQEKEYYFATCGFEVSNDTCIELQIINQETVNISLTIDGILIDPINYSWANDSLCFNYIKEGEYVFNIIAENLNGSDTSDYTINITQERPVELSDKYLLFNTTENSIYPIDSQVVYINSSCEDGILNWRSKIKSGFDWIQVDKLTGSNPDTLVISIVDSNYTAGIYSGVIEIYDFDGISESKYIYVSFFVEAGVDVGDEYTRPDQKVVIPVVISTNDSLKEFTIPLRYYTSQYENVILDSVIANSGISGLEIINVDDSTVIIRKVDDAFPYFCERSTEEPIIPCSTTTAKMYFTIAPEAYDELVVIDTVTVNYNAVDYSYQFVYPDSVVIPEFNPGSIIIGDGSCCVGPRGDVNGDNDNPLLPDISDLTYFIDWMFRAGPEPVCFEEADLNLDCILDISDLTFLIDFMFRDGPSLPYCSDLCIPKAYKQSGDVSINSYYGNNMTTLSIDSDFDLKGIQIELIGSSTEAPVKLADKNIEMFYHEQDGQTQIGLLDLQGSETIKAGSTNLVQLNGEYEIISAVVADMNHISVIPSIGEAMKQPTLPDVYSLNQNYPNPFNPVTQIEFALPNPGEVKLAVYNVIGQKVTTLIDGSMQAGYHSIEWDGVNSNGKQVSSGVYFYKIQAGDYSHSKKMLLLK